MTVKELKQYRSICVEIQELNIKIKDNTVYGAVRGSDSEFPYTQHTISLQGVTNTKDNMRLLRRLNMLIKQKESIDDFIEGIEDSLTRRIFEYRYIVGSRRLSWQAIAFKIGEHDEQYPRRIHNKFINNCNFDENDENKGL